MAAYRLSHEAQKDLEEIRRYTLGAWGPEQAKDQARRYLAGLALKFEQLAATPGLGRPREDLLPGIRGFPADQHVIFYREVKGGIEIARVLHSSMDVEGRLGE